MVESALEIAQRIVHTIKVRRKASDVRFHAGLANIGKFLLGGLAVTYPPMRKYALPIILIPMLGQFLFDLSKHPNAKSLTNKSMPDEFHDFKHGTQTGFNDMHLLWVLCGRALSPFWYRNRGNLFHFIGGVPQSFSGWPPSSLPKKFDGDVKLDGGDGSDPPEAPPAESFSSFLQVDGDEKLSTTPSSFIKTKSCRGGSSFIQIKSFLKNVYGNGKTYENPVTKFNTWVHSISPAYAVDEKFTQQI